MKAGVGIVVIAFVLMALVPAVRADYNATGKVEIQFHLIRDHDIKPHMYPGGDFSLVVYIHSNLHDATKAFGIWKFYMKTDWDSNWREKPGWETNATNNLYVEANTTTLIGVTHIKIPENVTIGNHSVMVKVQLYLYGSGWGVNEGTNTNYQYGTYNFTVLNSQGNGGSNEGSVVNSGGLPLWEIGAIIGVVIIAITGVAVTAIKRR